MNTIITMTIELTPDQLTQIIKNHFKDKQINVTNVNYKISDISNDRFDRFPVYGLSKIEVINTVNTDTLI